MMRHGEPEATLAITEPATRLTAEGVEQGTIPGLCIRVGQIAGVMHHTSSDEDETETEDE
jgi:hypothetical protein